MSTTKFLRERCEKIAAEIVQIESVIADFENCKAHSQNKDFKIKITVEIELHKYELNLKYIELQFAVNDLQMNLKDKK